MVPAILDSLFTLSLQPCSDLCSIGDALIEGYGMLRAEDLAMLPVCTLIRYLASVGWTIARLPPGDSGHRSYIDRALLAADHAL